MFFINILLLLHNVSFNIIDSINSKLTISLYLNDEYDKDSWEVIDLIYDIKNIDDSIIADYKTKDDVLEDLRSKDPDLVKIIERSNPLPDTINIKNISLKDFEKVNSAIENKSFILSKKEKDNEYFSNYNVQYEKINSIILVLNTLGLGLYIIIWIFLVSVAIIIYSIIWNFIYYYRDEIYITRLVWWSRLFIYWPFVYQWIIYSIVSFLISFIIFVLILDNISIVIWDLYTYTFSLNLFLIKLFIFIFIWWISWYFSSRKYLK